MCLHWTRQPLCLIGFSCFPIGCFKNPTAKRRKIGNGNMSFHPVISIVGLAHFTPPMDEVPSLSSLILGYFFPLIKVRGPFVETQRIFLCKQNINYAEILA